MPCSSERNDALVTAISPECAMVGIGKESWCLNREEGGRIHPYFYIYIYIFSWGVLVEVGGCGEKGGWTRLDTLKCDDCVWTNYQTLLSA